jgi:hypothetical protein
MAIAAAAARSEKESGRSKWPIGLSFEAGKNSVMLAMVVSGISDMSKGDSREVWDKVFLIASEGPDARMLRTFPAGGEVEGLTTSGNDESAAAARHRGAAEVERCDRRRFRMLSLHLSRGVRVSAFVSEGPKVA